MIATIRATLVGGWASLVFSAWIGCATEPAAPTHQSDPVLDPATDEAVSPIESACALPNTCPQGMLCGPWTTTQCGQHCLANDMHRCVDKPNGIRFPHLSTSSQQFRDCVAIGGGQPSCREHTGTIASLSCDAALCEP